MVEDAQNKKIAERMAIKWLKQVQI
jgi:hypothetical protein